MSQGVQRRMRRGLVAMGAWLWVVMALAQVGPTMPLYDAIRDGKVAISMRGTGASSGPGVVLELGKGPNAGPAPFA
jgi:hypothetical protein